MTTRHRTLSRFLAATLAVLSLVVGLAVPAAADGPALQHGPDTKSVDRLYHAYFERKPDSGGLAYWRQRHEQGMTLAHISQHFSQSSEFRTTYGHLDNAGFVTLIYRNVLDREPDTTGFAHWTETLNTGRLSRGGVMIGFSDSPEFKRTTGLFDTLPPGSYSFFITEGKAARWNPCAPIDVVLNLSEAPEIRPLVENAIAEMTRVTGVQWRIIGDTTEQIVVDGQGFSLRDVDEVIDLYGRRWPPVLFTVPEHYQHLSAGLAAPLTLPNAAGDPVIVSATVAINPLTARTGTMSNVYKTILHELGHAFGLAHSSDPASIMYEGGSFSSPGWSAGDLEGFRLLGPAAGCIEPPAPRRL